MSGELSTTALAVHGVRSVRSDCRGASVGWKSGAAGVDDHVGDEWLVHNGSGRPQAPFVAPVLSVGVGRLCIRGLVNRVILVRGSRVSASPSDRRLAFGIALDPRQGESSMRWTCFAQGPYATRGRTAKLGPKSMALQRTTLRLASPHAKQVHPIEQLAPATSECPVVVFGVGVGRLGWHRCFGERWLASWVGSGGRVGGVGSVGLGWHRCFRGRWLASWVGSVGWVGTAASGSGGWLAGLARVVGVAPLLPGGGGWVKGRVGGSGGQLLGLVCGGVR
ncbi:hypothetical protein JOD54_006367 [Actinokineospora baliensis]|nr:hypothetical protein [Actinokineospora baliensis]